MRNILKVATTAALLATTPAFAQEAPPLPPAIQTVDGFIDTATAICEQVQTVECWSKFDEMQGYVDIVVSNQYWLDQFGQDRNRGIQEHARERRAENREAISNARAIVNSLRRS